MGLGEPIRFLLSYGGVEFEDVRITHSSEDWSNMKPSIIHSFFFLLHFDKNLRISTISMFSQRPRSVSCPRWKSTAKFTRKHYLFAVTWPNSLICLAKLIWIRCRSTRSRALFTISDGVNIDFVPMQIDSFTNEYILAWIMFQFSYVIDKFSFFSFQWQYRLIIENPILF